MQPERDGGNSSIEQEPRRPGKPAPKALESGRIYRPKKATETPPNTSTRGSHRSNQEENKPTLQKQGPPKPRPGEPRKEKRTVSQFYAFRRVKAVTTGGTENGLKKEERHDRADSAYDKARTGTQAESQPPRK